MAARPDQQGRSNFDPAQALSRTVAGIGGGHLREFHRAQGNCHQSATRHRGYWQGLGVAQRIRPAEEDAQRSLSLLRSSILRGGDPVGAAIARPLAIDPGTSAAVIVRLRRALLETASIAALQTPPVRSARRPTSLEGYYLRHRFRRRPCWRTSQ